MSGPRGEVLWSEIIWKGETKPRYGTVYGTLVVFTRVSTVLGVRPCWEKRWLGLSGWCLPRFALQLPGMIIKRDLEEVLSGSSGARTCGSERDTGCVYLD